MDKFKGIIFDFNGTLLFDSNMHYEAWREFSKRLRGSALSDDEMQKFMLGRTNKDIIAYTLGKEPEPELIKKLAEKKESLYRQMCLKKGDDCQLAPYAVEFLEYLKEHNIPKTIATMAGKSNVEFYIEHFKLARWFDVDKIIYDDGSIKGKPAPDIYIKASNVLNLPPEDCVVIEDAVSGIEAARTACIGKIIAIASMESVAFYKNIPGISQIITDFHDFDGIMRRN